MRKYIMIWILPLLLCACESWLDVKPNDRISEDATFSTPRGFELALNGVYVDLNKTSLYGQALTWELVEILAQRYAINRSSTYNTEVMNFNYASSTIQGRVRSTWEAAYALIANINMILKNCDARREVLSDEYYGLIKGEALGIRALLHFDLFRLWGPRYSEETAASKSIPYYTFFALAGQPQLTTGDFMQKVTADLEEAAGLLQNDPVKTTVNPLAPDVANVFKGYRALRMNYYAVKLLQARVYLYINNKPMALAAAKELTDVQEKTFPWIEPYAISGSPDNPDRMFSSELVFALQNVNRKTIFTNRFDSDNLNAVALYAPDQKVVEQYVFDDEVEDLRYKAWLDKTVEKEGAKLKELMKYKATSSDSLYNQLIPMFRISEAFYIRAECEGEEDEQAGMNWLNKVRNARLLQNRPAYYYESVLESEYMREFWGEGQLFFFFKRKNQDEIPSAYEAYQSVTMTPANYVLRIPDEESKYN